MLFASQSNGKGIKLVPAVKKTKVEFDLTLKGKQFKIAGKFLDGQTEEQGWVVGSDENGSYLFKTTAEDTFKNAIFLKGDKPSPLFKSDALEMILDASEVVDKSLPIYLHPIVIEGIEGYEIYEMSNNSLEVLPTEPMVESTADLIPDALESEAHVSVEEISSINDIDALIAEMETDSSNEIIE